MKRTSYLIISSIIFFLSSMGVFAQNENIEPQSNQKKISFVPSHESTVKLLAHHNNILYSLDKNGLLIFSDTKTLQPQDYKIITRVGNIVSAKFFYPYIAISDTLNTLRIYNIINNLEVFIVNNYNSQNTSYQFSPSGGYFIYTKDKTINIVSSKSWQEKYKHSYIIEPRFITISNTESTYLIYDTAGEITYRNIDSGNVIKSISTQTNLFSLTPSISRRFAAGIIENKLISIDLVTGKMVDNLMFTNNIQALYSNEQSDTILILENNPNKQQQLRFFSFQKNGLLEENNINKITGLESVSTISALNDVLFFGKTTGQVLSYNFYDNQFLPISVDKTIANYDSIIKDNKLLFANSDGIRTITLENINTSSSQHQILFTQQDLHFPKFIQNTHANNDMGNLFLISNSVTNPLLFLIKPNNNFQTLISIPSKLSFMPSLTFMSKNTLFTYSQNISTLSLYNINTNNDIETTNTNKTKSIDIQEAFTYKIDETPQTPIFDIINTTNTITSLTNAQLQKKNKYGQSNILHSYAFAKNTNNNLNITNNTNISLPFETNTISYMRLLRKNMYLIIRNIDTPSSKEFECIIIFIEDTDIGKETQNNIEKNEPHIIAFSRIPYSANTRFFFHQQEQKDEQTLGSLIIADDEGLYLLRTQINQVQKNLSLLSKTFTPYPQKFGKLINIHVQKDNITAVDINNVALLAQIINSNIKMKSIMIIKDTEDKEGSLLTQEIQ